MIQQLLRIEVAADSLDTAVELALGHLHCSRAEADIEVLQVHSSGLLGIFGKRLARVRATLHDRGVIARQVLRHMLHLSDLDAEVSMTSTSSQIKLQLTAEEPSRLIGRHGQTLDALQTLVGTITDRLTTDSKPIEIDVDGYLERRQVFLGHLANRLLRKVRLTGKPAVSPPLTLSERRFLHERFKGEPGFESCSQNHEGGRKIIILQPRS